MDELKNVNIFYCTEKTYIDAITKELYKFSAEHGQGNRLKERYDNFQNGIEIDFAEAGFFAMANNILLGGLTYHIHNDWVFLHCGYVFEQYRKQGIYSKLIKSIEDMAKDRGLSGIGVSTYDFEAPQIYEHLGFTKGNILTNCPRGNTSIDYCKDFSDSSEKKRLTYWNDEFGCWTYHCPSGEAAKVLEQYENSETSIHGRWKIIDVCPAKTTDTHYCDICGGHGNNEMCYCPSCGTPMDGV